MSCKARQSSSHIVSQLAHEKGPLSEADIKRLRQVTSSQPGKTDGWEIIKPFLCSSEIEGQEKFVTPQEAWTLIPKRTIEKMEAKERVMPRTLNTLLLAINLITETQHVSLYGNFGALVDYIANVSCGLKVCRKKITSMKLSDLRTLATWNPDLLPYKPVVSGGMLDEKKDDFLPVVVQQCYEYMFRMVPGVVIMKWLIQIYTSRSMIFNYYHMICVTPLTDGHTDTLLEALCQENGASQLTDTTLTHFWTNWKEAQVFAFLFPTKESMLREELKAYATGLFTEFKKECDKTIRQRDRLVKQKKQREESEKCNKDLDQAEIAKLRAQRESERKEILSQQKTLEEERKKREEEMARLNRLAALQKKQKNPNRQNWDWVR